MILSFNGSSPFLSLTLSLFSYESFEEENLFLRERDEKDFFLIFKQIFQKYLRMDIQKLWSNIKQILLVHNNRIQTKEDFFQELEKHQESDDQKTYFH